MGVKSQGDNLPLVPFEGAEAISGRGVPDLGCLVEGSSGDSVSKNEESARRTTIICWRVAYPKGLLKERQ